VGFWSTSSVRRHIRTPWAVALTGGRVISRADGGYEVYGAPECAEGAPIGDSVQVGSMVFYHDGAGDQASVEIVETRAGDRQERGIDTILRCC
jgi:hypothetical protein